MIFNANKDLNNSSNVPYIGSPAVPMKLFNDMGNVNRGGNHFCSVVVGNDKNFPDKWIYADEARVKELIGEAPMKFKF